MSEKAVGVLHPGAMGVSVAASARDSGARVYWASEGRSIDTRKRAESAELNELVSLQELCAACDVLISVCPPHAAEDVAKKVVDCSFGGLYADVNAISPERALRIHRILNTAGVGFVDGGIIGGPAWKPGTTWLYLSGDQAEDVAGCFSNSPLETDVIGTEIGKASAVKMCFAANTKGSTALITAVLAASEALGVRDVLEKQWSRNSDSFVADTHARISGVSQKAWRFAGEMQEIASTFESVGLPGGFHGSAYEVYQRIAGFKGSDPLPKADEVVKKILGKE